MKNLISKNKALIAAISDPNPENLFREKVIGDSSEFLTANPIIH